MYKVAFHYLFEESNHARFEAERDYLDGEPSKTILLRLFSKYGVNTTYRSLIKKTLSFLIDSLETEINLPYKQRKYLPKYM